MIRMASVAATGALVLTLALPALAADTALPKPDANNAYYDWTPAQQLVGYRNMEKIFPTRVVKRGAKVSPLPKAAKEIAVRYSFKDQPWDTERFMREANATGLLILHNGKIELERYRAGYSADQRWTSFSVAKSFSSTLVGAAIKGGAIKSLDDRITDYLPGLKGSAYEGVTVRNLLNMTSGVKWNEDYGDPNADVAKIRAEKSINGSDPIVTYMARLKREAEPGTKFVYKTGETHLVGALVRAATHKDLAAYLSDKVWSRIGMQRDAVWILDPANHEYAGCCLSATTRDFARFGYFFMHGAKVDGKSIVPDGWEQAATTTSAVARRTNGSGYGYQWWTNADDTFQGVGIFGQMLMVDAKDDLVIVVQSAWPSATARAEGAMRAAYVDAVKAQIRGQKVASR
jgi:CubicO group peptidase (beta-lactamase class C family)